MHVVLDSDEALRPDLKQLESLGENPLYSQYAETWSLSGVEANGSTIPSGGYGIVAVGFAIADRSRDALVHPPIAST